MKIRKIMQIFAYASHLQVKIFVIMLYVAVS